MAFDYSTPLNERQRAAAGHDFGPMLVRAGAGTGKTTVLTQRIVRLVQAKIAAPHQILAITYTNAAAEEMQDRLREMLGDDAKQLTVSTFHGYCFAVLKRHRKTFELLTEEDLWVFLRRHLEQLGLKYFAKAAEPGAFLHDLLKFFERCSDELVGPDDYLAYVESLAADPNAELPRVGKTLKKEMPSREEVIARSREIARVFAAVEKMLAREDVGSFGALIVNTARLFQSDEAALRDERQRARFILVDEFQDTNHAQLTVIRSLADAEQNVFVVGDPDQAIYRFRGASAGAFDDFCRLFPSARAVTLADNQRSTQNILDCAYAAIACNPDATALDSGFARSPLYSARSRREPALVNAPVLLVHHNGDQQEGHEIARLIKLKRSAAKGRWSDFAILYRGHATAHRLLEELRLQDVPAVVSGGDLLETDNLRDLLAALSCMVSLDDNVSLFRLALMPRFAMDAAALRAALQAQPKPGNIVEVLTRSEAGNHLLAELQRISALVGANQAGVDAPTAVEKTLRQFALAHAPEAPYFRKLVADWMAKPCVGAKVCSGSLADFLDYLPLWRKAGGSLRAEECDALGARLRVTAAPNAVSLMTVHGAKGLEFRYVFIAKVVSPSFPTSLHEPLFDFPQALRKSAVSTHNEKQLCAEEERRLFYVALTRAQNELTLLGKIGRSTKSVMLGSGYMRELAHHPQLRGKLLVRAAAPMQISLIQAASSLPWYNLPAQQLTGDLHLSASAIETYEACPKKFYFKYEWSLPGEPTSALLYGSALHKALAALFAAHRLGKLLPLPALLEAFALNFTSTGCDDQHHYQLLLQQGRTRLTQFYQRQHQLGFPAVLATERWFSLPLEGVTLRGAIDRVDLEDGSLSILDYKTGNPKSEEQAGESTQLHVYALAAEAEWNQRVTAVNFYNLETNEAVGAAITPADLHATREKISAIAARISAGEFPAKPTSHMICRWCDYRALCPATVQQFFAPQDRPHAKTTAAI